MNSRNRNLPHARNVDLPGTIHNHPQVRIDLTPDADLQLVVRTYHVIARNLYPVRRSKCAGRLGKKRLAEKRKRAPNRVRHNLFELGVRMQWQFDFLDAATDSPEAPSLSPGISGRPDGQLRRLDQRRHIEPCCWRSTFRCCCCVLRATRGRSATATGRRQAVRLRRLVPKKSNPARRRSLREPQLSATKDKSRLTNLRTYMAVRSSPNSL